MSTSPDAERGHGSVRLLAPPFSGAARRAARPVVTPAAFRPAVTPGGVAPANGTPLVTETAVPPIGSDAPPARTLEPWSPILTLPGEATMESSRDEEAPVAAAEADPYVEASRAAIDDTVPGGPVPLPAMPSVDAAAPALEPDLASSPWVVEPPAAEREVESPVAEREVEPPVAEREVESPVAEREVEDAPAVGRGGDDAITIARKADDAEMVDAVTLDAAAGDAPEAVRAESGADEATAAWPPSARATPGGDSPRIGDAASVPADAASAPAGGDAEAQHVADLLEAVARRIRAGQLELSASATDLPEAAVARVLLSLLTQRP